MPSIESTDSVQIEAPAATVFEVVRDYASMHSWFPSYRCRVVGGGPVEQGARVEHEVKALGTTTRFVRTVRRLVPGARLEESYDEGDILGEGTWTFEQQGAWTTATYHCRVRSNSLLNHLGFALIGELGHKMVYRGLLAALKIKCEQLDAPAADAARG